MSLLIRAAYKCDKGGSVMKRFSVGFEEHAILVPIKNFQPLVFRSSKFNNHSLAKFSFAKKASFQWTD